MSAAESPPERATSTHVNAQPTFAEMPQTAPTTPAAVLFDMDGLLVDTEPVWAIAEVELVARLGGSWSDELKQAIVGTRLDVSVPTILRWYGVDPEPQVVAESSRWLLGRMVELFAQGVAVQPGALELLAGLRRAEVPVALVSSSYRVLVDAVLGQGLGPFALSVAGDEVGHPKPHPEPYLSACARLQVEPSRCVVLEDSPTGAASGEAAGCAVFVVPSVPGVELHPGPRTLVRASLADVSVEDLVAAAG